MQGPAVGRGAPHHQLHAAPAVVGAIAIAVEGAAEVAHGEGGGGVERADLRQRLAERGQRPRQLAQQGTVAVGGHLVLVGVEAAQADEVHLPSVPDRRAAAGLDHARHHPQLRGQPAVREHGGDVAAVGRVQHRAQLAIQGDRALPQQRIAVLHHRRVRGIDHRAQRLVANPVRVAAVIAEAGEHGRSAGRQHERQGAAPGLEQVVAGDRDRWRQHLQTGVGGLHVVGQQPTPPLRRRVVGMAAHPQALLVVVRIQVHRQASQPVEHIVAADRLDQRPDVGEEGELAALE